MGRHIRAYVNYSQALHLLDRDAGSEVRLAGSSAGDRCPQTS